MDELVPSCFSSWTCFLNCCTFIIYKIYPPTVKETPNAKSWAENELATMGKIALAEKFMIGILSLL